MTWPPRGDPVVSALDLPRCAHCGDVIGAYEPLVVRARGEVRKTSLAADPALPLPDAEHYHLACWSAAAP